MCMGEGWWSCTCEWECLWSPKECVRAHKDSGGGESHLIRVPGTKLRFSVTSVLLATEPPFQLPLSIFRVRKQRRNNPQSYSIHQEFRQVIHSWQKGDTVLKNKTEQKNIDFHISTSSFDLNFNLLNTKLGFISSCKKFIFEYIKRFHCK